jgi:tyrosyl-tRNA synthetase
MIKGGFKMSAENIFDILKERGFIEQITHEDEVRELLAKDSVPFYVGFDPTADSLHVGHFIQVMVMMHMQRAGHCPIALVGGGTVMVGDPTGKTDMRKMLSVEAIDENVARIKSQLSKYVVLDDVKGRLVNNGDWLRNLNYIEFLRDIGKHFNVNKMLQAECFKARMEKGLSFLEFNYMIMQSYDFLELNRRYNCQLEFGGNDQWSNIIGGVNLIRKVDQKPAYGLTFKLLTTSEGKKMGKTENGAVWIDPEKTSPYELYQYFRNVEDNDVENCLALLTFIPMDEVRRLGALEGADLNAAKEILAFEVTKIIHSEEDAKKAQDTARALFSGNGVPVDAPATAMDKSEFENGLGLLALLTQLGLTKSNGEARRLVQQGGISIDGEKITDPKFEVGLDLFKNGEILIKKGKKVYHKVTL